MQLCRKTFYIRANRCSSLYNDIFALRGWKKVELGGIEFELASILIEKWKGKAYRLVIQRQKRIDGELDLCGKENTPTAASLQMTTRLPRERLSNSTTLVERRSASSMT